MEGKTFSLVFVPACFVFFPWVISYTSVCSSCYFSPSFEAAVHRNSDALGFLLHGSAQAGSQLVLLFCWCPVTPKICFPLSFFTYEKNVSCLFLVSWVRFLFIQVVWVPQQICSLAWKRNQIPSVRLFEFVSRKWSGMVRIGLWLLELPLISPVPQHELIWAASLLACDWSWPLTQGILQLLCPCHCYHSCLFGFFKRYSYLSFSRVHPSLWHFMRENLWTTGVNLCRIPAALQSGNCQKSIIFQYLSFFLLPHPLPYLAILAFVCKYWPPLKGYVSLSLLLVFHNVAKTCFLVRLMLFLLSLWIVCCGWHSGASMWKTMHHAREMCGQIICVCVYEKQPFLQETVTLGLKTAWESWNCWKHVYRGNSGRFITAIRGMRLSKNKKLYDSFSRCDPFTFNCNFRIWEGLGMERLM